MGLSENTSRTPVTVQVLDGLTKELATVDPEASVVLRADGTGRLIVGGVRHDFYSTDELVERVNDFVYGSQSN